MLNVKKTLTKMLSGISGSNNCLRLGKVALCWGVVDLAGITANEFRTGSVTYPCVFATNPSTVMTLQDTSASPQLISWEVYANTTTSFTWGMKSTYNGDYGTSHAYWIAIGLIGGGYFLKVFSIFSHLAERWWEYAERKEDSHQTSADNRNKLHQILWNWYCVGVIFIKRNLGIHATVWDYIFGNADSGFIKSGERINSVNHHCGSKDNDAILGKLQHYGKHQECRLGRNRQGVAISERGWSCA